MHASNTMTVGELRELLSGHDNDTRVFLAVPSGDYWGTVLARPLVTGDQTLIEWEDRSSSYILTDEGHDEDREWALVLGLPE